MSLAAHGDALVALFTRAITDRLGNVHDELTGRFVTKNNAGGSLVKAIVSHLRAGRLARTEPEHVDELMHQLAMEPPHNLKLL